MNGWPTFAEFFEALWGRGPFPWQTMLAERLIAGSWPRLVDLPTAAGKTACLDAAIYALASQAERPLAERTAPRRVWFVVDRRIVVDEAFERARTIAEKLAKPSAGALEAVAARLRDLSGTGRPVVAARLRGGFLRGDRWARLPSQPAIIASTVDQLGSRLLFRGYGRSARTAPIWAGLAAHDSLILLDEAQCAKPFLETLRLIELYRGERWAERPLRTPFAFAALSATPPREGLDPSEEAIFPGPLREQALDDAELRRRFGASKPAELVVVASTKTGDPLVPEAVERAKAAIRDGRRRIAVIVNRVRTAAEIAARLRVEAQGAFDVRLLTGRMRPYDRDRLVGELTPVLRATEPQESERPVALVSTQALEVGADFSFDALASEAASLDALRQRFGRLNRLGRLQATSAAVLIRKDDTTGKKPDPVYGDALARCWTLLDGWAREEGEGRRARRIVDFGVEAMRERMEEADAEDVAAALAPASGAPVLFPAHLDLLCQTSPRPAVEPEIALYLHGLERGAPEARVVWRADLDPREANKGEVWVETAALCPPLAGEMLAVPLYRLREWLTAPSADLDARDADVEGAGGEKEAPEEAPEEAPGAVRPALVWRGRDRSAVFERAAELAPDDIVVLPAAYGADGLAPTIDRLDIWEECRTASEAGAAVRLHRALWAERIEAPGAAEMLAAAEAEETERAELDERIAAVLEAPESSLPEDVRERLRACRGGRLERHPGGGVVLFAKPPLTVEEADLFADDDDSRSLAGQGIPLARHLAEAARAAERLAAHCLPAGLRDAVREAALWHDAGKLDSRFQALLRQGDEAAAAAEEPLAKSPAVPASPARARAIFAASGLPEGFRHEMLSAELAARFGAFDGEQGELGLHLIASHHGHARPFAPVAPDAEPPGVAGELLGARLEFPAEERAAAPPAHRIDSGVSERFWRLNRRYGWWGLAYLEAVVRLSDWYASEHSQAPAGLPALAVRPARLAAPAKPEREIELAGIDGANPLGFLAALGALAVLREAGYEGAKMHWRRAAAWRPVLSGLGDSDEAELCERIAKTLRGAPVAAEAEQARAQAEKHVADLKTALKNAEKAIKERKLRGAERTAALAELDPLRQQLSAAQAAALQARKAAVPSPELALGKRIDCSANEFRDEFALPLIDGADCARRGPLDLLTAFASDACADPKTGRVEATLFCFIAGSGQQYFLNTARLLAGEASPERVRRTLLEPWRYEDEKLSMRWDPGEDRRYALLDRDPTAGGNEPRTEWMANLLGYRALALFPSAPRRRRLATTAWFSDAAGNDLFVWPLWTVAADLGSIGSLLAAAPGGRGSEGADARSRGVRAWLRAQRIKVGNPPRVTINFSPATELWRPLARLPE